MCYQEWSNASNYKETAESFDSVAIQNASLHRALMEQWEDSINKNIVRLTPDQKHLCAAMGPPLPFLPFATVDENKQFAECVLSNDFPPMLNEEMASIEWCKYVDGVKIFPKLPVHIRLHREVFERNRRVKECVRQAKQGQNLLNELNKTITITSAASGALANPIINPEPVPLMPPQAMNNHPYVITGGTAVGVIPMSNEQ